MYIPAHYKQDDRDAVIAFMKQHPFAIIVSNDSNIPVATHLPFHIHADEEAITLTAHFARANPQWKSLHEVLVIFSGPHAYISPQHYERQENVPTWNYIAVHAYGKAEIMENPEEGISILEDMIRQSEPAYLEQWTSLPKKYQAGLYQGIVPFRIKVTRLDAKHKLSQNKTEGERENIIQALSESHTGAGQELAAYMKQRELQR